MNKTIALIVMALLGSTSVAYAERADVINEYKDYIDEGVPPEDETADVPDAVKGVQDDWVLPLNVITDDSQPKRMVFCRVQSRVMDDTDLPPSPRVMADFPVTAELEVGGNPPIIDGPYDFQFVDPALKGGGVAQSTAYDWELRQYGKESWDQPWAIHVGSGIKLKSITIDLLEKKGNPKAGFDILLRPVPQTGPGAGTDGSGIGWPVQPMKPFKTVPIPGMLGIDFNVSYSRPIVVPQHSYQLLDPHDMYGKVTIEFPDGVEGAGAFDLAFMFWADTDCLPGTEVTATQKEGNNYSIKVELSSANETVTFYENGQRVETVMSDAPGDVVEFDYEVKEGAHYEASSDIAGELEIEVN